MLLKQICAGESIASCLGLHGRARLAIHTRVAATAAPYSSMKNTHRSSCVCCVGHHRWYGSAQPCFPQGLPSTSRGMSLLDAPCQQPRLASIMILSYYSLATCLVSCELSQLLAELAMQMVTLSRQDMLTAFQDSQVRTRCTQSQAAAASPEALYVSAPHQRSACCCCGDTAQELAPPHACCVLHTACCCTHPWPGVCSCCLIQSSEILLGHSAVCSVSTLGQDPSRCVFVCRRR